MTNHPNRARTYWHNEERGFANEFSVGVATRPEFAADYAARGYEKVTRAYALKEMTYRGDAATTAYVGVTINGVPADDRFELARRIRAGLPI
jgi:hypothetical protein